MESPAFLAARNLNFSSRFMAVSESATRRELQQTTRLQLLRINISRGSLRLEHFTPRVEIQAKLAGEEQKNFSAFFILDIKKSKKAGGKGPIGPKPPNKHDKEDDEDDEEDDDEDKEDDDEEDDDEGDEEHNIEDDEEEDEHETEDEDEDEHDD